MTKRYSEEQIIKAIKEHEAGREGGRHLSSAEYFQRNVLQLA